jgi:hypothetical protein
LNIKVNQLEVTKEDGATNLKANPKTNHKANHKALVDTQTLQN